MDISKSNYLVIIWESWDDFLKVITGIFTGVDQELLLVVFKSWLNRLK
jgi:hypothetical protein